MTIDADITQLFEKLSYAGLFLWLILYYILFFVPLPPEEIIVLTVGYIASLGYINPLLGGLLIVGAALVADSILFVLTKKGDKFVNKIINKFGEKIFLNYKNKMGHQILGTMITIAFIPRVRFFGPIILASLKTNWRKFLLYDLIVNIIYCTFYITIGYLFHNTATHLLGQIQAGGHIILYSSMLLISLILIYLLSKKIIQKK